MNLNEVCASAIRFLCVHELIAPSELDSLFAKHFQIVSHANQIEWILVTYSN